jgi:hypothetical protein
LRLIRLKIFTPNNQAGLSLIGLIVSLAIFGLLAVIFSNMFKNQMTISNKIEDRGEVEDLRNFIRLGVDCTETKATWPASCPNGTVIALKRSSTATTPLVSTNTGSTRTKIGPYYLQAKCNGVAKQYMVFYSKVYSVAGAALFSTPRICP